jgi:hypothetical protein
MGGPEIPLDVRETTTVTMMDSEHGLRILTDYRAALLGSEWKENDFDNLVNIREQRYRLMIQEGARTLDDFVPLNLIPLDLQAEWGLKIPLVGDAVRTYAFIETILQDGPGRAPNPNWGEIIFNPLDTLSAEMDYGARFALHSAYQRVTGSSSTPIGNGRGWLDANGVRYSQENIGWTTRDGMTLPQLAESLGRGWSKEPINVVIMPDGHVTSMDNRRLYASRDAGTDVYVKIRGFDEMLTAAERRAYRDPKTRVSPTTCGQAITARISRQDYNFAGHSPYGSYTNPAIRFRRGQ